MGILLLLAGGYLWWRHKRSQLKFIEPDEFDEESPNAGIDPALLNLITSSQSNNFSNSQNQFGGGGPGGAGSAAGASAGGNQKGDTASTGVSSAVTAFAATNNLNKKLNGFLNLKTPLIGG